MIRFPVEHHSHVPLMDLTFTPYICGQLLYRRPTLTFLNGMYCVGVLNLYSRNFDSLSSKWRYSSVRLHRISCGRYRKGSGWKGGIPTMQRDISRADSTLMLSNMVGDRWVAFTWNIFPNHADMGTTRVRYPQYEVLSAFPNYRLALTKSEVSGRKARYSPS